MQINLFAETLIPLHAAAKFVGTMTGKTPHISTPWRWSTKGVAGVILETIYANGQRWTSEEAVQRFLIRSTEAKQAQHVAVSRLIDTSVDLKRASELDQQAKDEGI